MSSSHGFNFTPFFQFSYSCEGDSQIRIGDIAQIMDAAGKVSSHPETLAEGNLLVSSLDIGGGQGVRSEFSATAKEVTRSVKKGFLGILGSVDVVQSSSGRIDSSIAGPQLAALAAYTERAVSESTNYPVITKKLSLNVEVPRNLTRDKGLGQTLLDAAAKWYPLNEDDDSRPDIVFYDRTTYGIPRFGIIPPERLSFADSVARQQNILGDIFGADSASAIIRRQYGAPSTELGEILGKASNMSPIDAARFVLGALTYTPRYAH